ncbi:MAG: PIN domain-containing protein [Lachnospiraceae bacterium]|nr:PIN domain-containing protein [Lachnospiraceae bacterium]
MRILIDTNIILDYLLKRPEYYNAVRQVVELCVEGNISGYIAPISYPNAYYILRKQMSDEERRELLLDLCQIFETVAIDHDMIVSALKWKDFKDFEDCIQAECAIVVGADYIVTRNAKDFKECNIKCVTAGEFCEIIRSQSEDAAT